MPSWIHQFLIILALASGSGFFLGIGATATEEENKRNGVSESGMDATAMPAAALLFAVFFYLQYADEEGAFRAVSLWMGVGLILVALVCWLLGVLFGAWLRGVLRKSST
jgi:hypothetical protein